MDEEGHILTELSSLDDLVLPLSRSARLKYNCLSVSSKFIALGSNTGGIYLFARETRKLIQAVFADKETSPVVMVTLCPNDKFVAMVVSSGHLHVIDLKVESRAKPETLRSITDFWNGTVTCLHWDCTSSNTRLYIGDTMGRVYYMTVHSSKAKNLFSLPLETIMRLDSSVVQIDKADDKLLVSTMTRCFLCDTVRQQYSQIGKKSRDGQFGACFLRQGLSTPSIYCARPGSRIWEVDFDGSVLNTLEFKQLLAIPPLPVVRVKEHLELPSKDSRYAVQSINFPRLKVISGSFILTWTATAIYVLDPVNVKVILWTQPFSEILDVCCLNSEIYVFLPSMQVHCLTLIPVSRVTALCLKSEAYINAASLCIFFKDSYCHRRKTGYFGLAELKQLYDILVKLKMSDSAESVHLTIVNTERKLAALSESGSSESGKSRTNSFVDKDTSEKNSNHKLEKSAISNQEIVHNRHIEVDGALELNPDRTGIDVQGNIARPLIEDSEAGLVAEIKISDGTRERNVESLNQFKNEHTEIQNIPKDGSDLTQNHIETYPVSQCDRSDLHEFNADRNNEVIQKTAIEELVENMDSQVAQNHGTSCNENVCVETNLSVSLEAQNNEQDKSTGMPDNKIIHHIESTTNSDEKKLMAYEDAVITKDKSDDVIQTLGENSENLKNENSENLTNDKDKYYDTGQVSASNDNSKESCDIGAEESIKLVLDTNIETEEVFPEVVIRVADDENYLETKTDPWLDNTILPNVHTSDLINQSLAQSASPLPTSYLKSDETDDIFEDDLDLQNRSSGMGSRRTSLTSLSSLSSAEVYLEQVTGTVPGSEEIAVPVKRKSSKRRQRKSVEGTGESKKIEVKINRSLSLGAIQTHSRKDFSVSPQGSLDHTIEEDCFTATNHKSGKSEQQMVSQSSPVGTIVEKHARSLPNIETFETNFTNVTELPAPVSEDVDLDEGSVLSLSSEFSKSGDYGKSGDYSPSESPLLRSFEGTREGISASPKTALRHLKNRVQKNLKSQTKRVITNIKDKNLLTRAKVFLSQPIDHQKSEFSIQAHGFEGHQIVGTGQEQQFLDETGSSPQSPVDISALQDKTAETQEKLQDPSVLLNPDTVYKILLDWITVLNRTFYNLHMMKYARCAPSHLEAVSNQVPEDSDQNNLDKGLPNQSEAGTESSENKKRFSASMEINADQVVENVQSEQTGSFELQFIDKTKVINSQKGESVQIKETVKNEGPGASILNDKDFCYTKDPLFLPTDAFMNVSELAQACLSIGCHGNSLQYKDLHKLETFKVDDATLSEVCDNSKGAQNSVPSNYSKVQGHIPEGDHHSKGQGFQGEKDDLCDNCDNSKNTVCDTFSKSATTVQTLQTENSLSADASFGSNKSMLHIRSSAGSSGTVLETCTSSNIPKLQDLSVGNIETSIADEHLSMKCPNSATADKILDESHQTDDYDKLVSDDRNHGNKLLSGDCYHGDKVPSDDCNHGDKDNVSDEEMAFFVRCYFPYLSARGIRNKTKEHGKSLYKTWCAFVCCLQELACADSERYGVDNDALLQHMFESLSAGDDGYILLGHISKLFKIKSESIVSACAHCHPYVQPLDVLYMCSLHGVAMETTFKSYMQQMIQDATRLHRKDTISLLYVNPEVKRAWLEILLSDEENIHEMVNSNGKPRVYSHTHIWKNQPAIEDIVRQPMAIEDKHGVMEICAKYGFWNGCLRILKDLEDHMKHINMILHLDDASLLSDKNPLGYLPKSIEDWKQLLQAYKHHSEKLASDYAGNQSEIITVPDWADRITWNSLAVLLVRHLGPSQAVSLLQEVDVPESCLTATFYQTCAIAGLVHKHQRFVLHSMLEKIDTYLWAQRPVYTSPQLHHIVVKEKELQGKGSNSSQQDHLQRLIQQVKSDRDEVQTQYVEDPDCHWGVETKINLVCPCCNIALKEAVSHVEPGVLLFKCGHGYHRMCLPERDCFLCSDKASHAQGNSFV